VVLPAATNLDCADLYQSYAIIGCGEREAVIPPVGENRCRTPRSPSPAARFGFEEPCFKATDEELMDEDDAVDRPNPGAGGPPTSQISTHKRRCRLTGPDGNRSFLFHKRLSGDAVRARSSSNPRHWPSGWDAAAYCRVGGNGKPRIP